jgi:hypothetical protein
VNQLKDKLHVKGVLVTLSERGAFIDFEGRSTWCRRTCARLPTYRGPATRW